MNESEGIVVGPRRQADGTRAKSHTLKVHARAGTTITIGRSVGSGIDDLFVFLHARRTEETRYLAALQYINRETEKTEVTDSLTMFCG